MAILWSSLKRSGHASYDTRASVIRLAELGLNAKEIHERLNFGSDWSVRSVRRWVRVWNELGIICPDSRRPWVSREYYSEEALQCMERIINEDNALKAEEVHQKVFDITGEAASLSTCRRAMRKLKFKRKVACTQSWRQNKELNKQHAEVRELYHPRCLLFADEMHKRVSSDNDRAHDSAKRH